MCGERAEAPGRPQRCTNQPGNLSFGDKVLVKSLSVLTCPSKRMSMRTFVFLPLINFFLRKTRPAGYCSFIWR